MSIKMAFKNKHENVLPEIDNDGNTDSLFKFELFGAEQRELHGKTLASTHRIIPGRSRDRLLAQLDENENILLEIHQLLVLDIEADRQITIAGEWLLDNFYIIEEQIRMTRRHLPKGYNRELPHLSNTNSKGLPRVFDIAQVAIAHGDGRVDAERLGDLVAAYQSVTELNLGELWAIPIMLRLALIENIQKIASVIAAHRADRCQANDWADQMTLIAAKEPKNLILVIADMARSMPLLTSSFVSEFSYRIRALEPVLALPLIWVEQQLSESNLTIEQVIHTENQIQAANQVSMGNCIGSLRTLNAMNWRDFVERMSTVHQTLSNDPAGIYAQMDFTTRDHYRHVVEKSAKTSPCSETELASKAIQLSQEALNIHGENDRRGHVGFYLIDAGLIKLEKSAAVCVPFRTKIGRITKHFSLPIYLTGILLITAAICFGLIAKTLDDGFSHWMLCLAIPLFILGGGQLAIAVANWLSSIIVTPMTLPRMDFSKGIPEELRTLVVIPTMLTDTRSIDTLLRDLEVRFMANRDDHIHFALLTDFRDAPHETEPEDANLLHEVRKRTNALNQKYQNDRADIFFVFHRPRIWNPQEQIWMGYERKRGKLAAMNGYLRDKNPDRFLLVVGETEALSNVKYVITLDTDTQLARDSARQFIGTMAHPLNRPLFDTARQRIISGYGILQPRVTASMTSEGRSLYTWLHDGQVGIDPYTRASSDLYQDLFAEGSFIGKGIYEIDAFEKALSGRFPENCILSHDLLEGCYARSGLMNDVHLYEKSPTRYSEDVTRRHRWIRGDWQIARWAFFARISWLSRLKILDNLRRSLTAAVLTLTLLVGWFASPSPWFLSLAVLGVLLIPPLLSAFANMLQKTTEMTWRQHVLSIFRSVPRSLGQSLFIVTMLPFEAFYSLDAVVRALWRMTVSHKKLLQWTPSSERNKQLTYGLRASCKYLWFGTFMAVVTLALLVVFKPSAFIWACPFLTLWFVSPLIAWRISKTPAKQRDRLSTAQMIVLKRIARKTWQYFETFVGADDHWLPPDNYQEYPVIKIAHRTSPTNIGLSLLANLAAYDFGAITAGRFVERTSNTFQTLNALERYRGHFFNWYDTQTLRPLPPRYVSSVDSGNLAGHLITLRAGLRELAEKPLLGKQVFMGLGDTIEVAKDYVAQNGNTRFAKLCKQTEMFLETVSLTSSVNVSEIKRHLELLHDLSSELFADLSVPDTDWIAAFKVQCQNALDELNQFYPWLDSGTCQDIPVPDKMMSLQELAALTDTLTGTLKDTMTDEQPELLAMFASGIRCAKNRLAKIESLIEQCGTLSQMEYDFLYDETRHLLSIGYNVDDGRRDAGFYDLLSSEARLASFVGISQGCLPQENWFALGRILTSGGRRPVLLSWSGSMFEYLMPQLVMPSYENTLLDETAKAVVEWQIEYGKSRKVPWGISESGYYTFDAHLNYQYRAFGVPGLGLNRGLASDLVIAPYSTVMALMVAPKESVQNMKRLTDEGFEGPYGFYEAIDYTPARLPHGHSIGIVRSFMTHHQGMSLLALAYRLLDKPMQRRFASDIAFQATLLLLQEKVPESAAFYTHTASHPELKKASKTQDTPVRVFTSPDTLHPEVQLLSNGNYHVMVTNSGGGYSRWKDIAVTRWREDTTRDQWGTFCYLRDTATGEFWSTAYQPTRKQAKNYEAVFSEGRAEFTGSRNHYDTRLEIVVSPEDDVELRRIRITNRAQIRRTIEVTGFTEVVLAPPMSDTLHPAFSNLFVQTEIFPQHNAIFAVRRPRSEGEFCPYMLKMMSIHSTESGTEISPVSYETDRQQFIGRGGSAMQPQAMLDDELSGTAGSVLDPVMALRSCISLDPEQSVTIEIAIGIAETREAAVKLSEKYHDQYVTDRIFNMAWTQGQALLRQLNITDTASQHYNNLAGSILYANSTLRAPESVLVKNRQGQSGLWGYAISGDLPIVLLKIEDQANIDIVRQLLKAHEYWRLKGLSVDLVIWNEDQLGYRQRLNDQIIELITSISGGNLTDRPGGIFLRAADRIAEEDRILIKTVARVIVSDTRGTLSEQIEGFHFKKMSIPALAATKNNSAVPASSPPALPPRADLIFHNGLGGFTPDGREYVICTDSAHRTPAPWVNVLANPHFGTVISESGASYTWSENAHEFRLTPWNNDPISDDSSGEAFYLRDEENGKFWSPMPFPCSGVTPYTTRHGFGYTIFEHTEYGVSSEVSVFAATDAPVKFVSLKVRNVSGQPKRLSAYGYVEWVLGDLRSKSAAFIATEIDTGTGAVFARNSYNTEFHRRTAFFDVDDSRRSVSCDREEFIGRNGTLSVPAAMKRTKLSGKVGAAIDPCAAIKVDFDLADGQERIITFKMGVGKDVIDARTLVSRFRGAAASRSAIDAVWRHWSHTLGTVYVETPEPSFNVLVNGWLLYQTLSCRLWGRSATYQSGGAFGFRDQLQDAQALIYARPDLLREHLLLCAAHQFIEGDVLHWWHPPMERGVRTHCSDDYLWLPLATSRYVSATGDTGILDEIVPFIEGRSLREGEDSYYDLPVKSNEKANLYQHCVRAVTNGLKFGVHGLPLIGSGDWNDGMDLIGKEGKGESVWLGFFLYDVLIRFMDIARLCNDDAFADRCFEEAAVLRKNLESHGWDGEWYRRAYFDDGSPLGSSVNVECQIDSIVQSWSVLSGAGEAKRSVTAMLSLDDRLVRQEEGLIQLFDPPFDTSALNPGYIKGYVPGVRENGGQYTHAAIWAAMAFAQLGNKEKAWELFSLISPVNHTNTPEAAETYKVEPYIMAADVYHSPSHIGRGGWTWYTGSAAWMYRLMLESLLGLHLKDNQLSFHPCLPDYWETFTVHYRFRETVYHITVLQTENAAPSISIDGQMQEQLVIPLVDDRREHWVEAKIL